VGVEEAPTQMAYYRLSLGE